MRWGILRREMPIRVATVLACAAFVVASAHGGAADAQFRSKPQSHALVYADRNNPESFVLVEDIRVNYTISNPDGDRFFVLKTSQGTFDLPFESVAEVLFTRFHAMEFLETAAYDVTVTLPLHGVRRGTIELSNLKGTSARHPWHHLLMTRRENAERMHRILFVRRD
jgi:hypothetical protein